MELSMVKAQCGSCNEIAVYSKAHNEGCSSCGSKSLWLVFDESCVEKQSGNYILGVDLANGKDRTIIDGVMNDG